MEMTPVVELGVDDAYRLLKERFGVVDLPPLLAIENEDWGRDRLLSRFQQLTPSNLPTQG